MLARRTQHLRHRALEDEPVRRAAPGSGPISTTWSAARIIASSCSTTTTVLPAAGQRADDRDQPVDVARVQPDARLVQDEEGVDERRAEARGEVDALDLAAGERPRGPVEREVAEPDLLQVAQARDDRVVGELGGGRPGPAPGAARPASSRSRRKSPTGIRVELRKRAPAPFPAERLGLQPRAAAVRAGVVGAEAGEEHPHVHLVGVLLQPAEESLHAVPVLRPGPCRSPRRIRARPSIT